MTGVLLYDGESRLFTRSARWLARHAHSAAGVQALQHTELALLGLRPADVTEGLQWVEDGRCAFGPDAVAAYLCAGNDRWRTAGRLLASPVARRVTWPVYRWAAHRGETPAGMGIRRRRAKDLPACASLLGVVFRGGQYPVHWPQAPRAWLDGDDVLDAWVFERGGEIHGHVAISKVGLDSQSALRWREVTGHEPSELAGVTRLFVRPRLRGQGIGRALLDVAVAEIRSRGLFPVLDVVSASKAAIELYDDLGWRRRAVYPWGDEEEGLEIYFYEAPPALGVPEDAPPP